MTTDEDKLIQTTWRRAHEAKRARNIEVGVGALQGALFHADTIFNRDNAPAFDALGVGSEAIYRLVQVWPSESDEYIRSGWTLRRPTGDVALQTDYIYLEMRVEDHNHLRSEDHS